MGSASRSESKIASIEARLKYETEQAFIEKYASNISQTGIFVKTANPRPVGTRVKFEFQIADGTPVFRGLGEVEWERRGTFPDQPPGMNIRFLKLDSKSRMIVERIAEFNKRKEEAASAAPVKSVSAGADKIELGSRTRERRAAARLRRQEGRGVGTKEINLQSVESMLKEIDAAPAPLRKKRTVAGIAEKPEETKNEPREATPDKGPALSLNTDQKNSPDSNLNDIMNETAENEDIGSDEYDDGTDEPYDSSEDIPAGESQPQAPLLETSEVDKALSKLFVNFEVIDTSESKTTRYEPMEVVSQEPAGATDSIQSKMEGASESPLPVSADSEVPASDSQQPDKPAQNGKKKGFFRKLFS